MAFNDSITRAAADALIPTEYADQIVTATVEQSAALQRCRVVRMGAAQQRVPVLSVLPRAFWIASDTGLKPTSDASWVGIYLNAEEVASITPVPENVIADATFDIFGELKAPIGQSIAQKLDAAVFSGIEKPATWPPGLIAGATTALNAIEADATPAEGAVIGDLADLLAAVEADGFTPDGFVGDKTLRPLLRSARSTTGESLAGAGDNFTVDSAWGLPISYAVTGSTGSSLALAGEWANAIVGVRQDLTFKILDQAVIQDDTGAILFNFAQQDMVGLRVTARFGFAVGVPATLAGDASRYPFAVLNPVAPPPLSSGEKTHAPASRK
jgi:HK97 family phage major capsid protein